MPTNDGINTRVHKQTHSACSVDLQPRCWVALPLKCSTVLNLQKLGRIFNTGSQLRGSRPDANYTKVTEHSGDWTLKTSVLVANQKLCATVLETNFLQTAGNLWNFQIWSKSSWEIHFFFQQSGCMDANKSRRTGAFEAQMWGARSTKNETARLCQPRNIVRKHF